MTDPLQLSIDPTALGMEFGTGAVIGGVVGFAAKKVAKLVAVIVGVELALFKYLESQGILTVDWERLTAGLVSTTREAASGTPPHWLSSLLSTVSISAGFTGGFLVGFKKG